VLFKCFGKIEDAFKKMLPYEVQDKLVYKFAFN